MKLDKVTFLTAVSIVLTLAAVGCRKTPTALTRLPDYSKAGPIPDLPPTTPFNTNDLANTPAAFGTNAPFGTPIADPELRKNWLRDRSVFQANTVHFDFDSSTVKPKEQVNVEAVASYLKSHPGNALEVEGHADERGTAEYNRSLGERRALALRENLARLGVDPMLIDTTSYGKDRPVDTGHSEGAHRKNRRGEFLLETPPGGAK